MSKLLVMCGVPGSGKSTWASKFVNENNAIVVSRDAIRFSLLEEGEDYFSHENEVTEKYYEELRNLLKSNKYEYVIADATHNTGRARTNMLREVMPSGGASEIIPVYFNIPMEVCKERNNLRKGLAKVPEDVIERMCHQRSKPKLRGEGYWYSEIWEVDENGNLRSFGLAPES